ncbi:polysaccharide deacetylase family protein [Tamlana sp. 2201CG12-4]|uniref:polysaccharide deacetylase family protein n=1 Tax=Tamlana sp. 2201CG12-4 TaxID=3112582 RepID=UPI002DB5EEB8|nr:polysaccharide deacetylase family protein [Tamlana sp. 2201CG12-4]MEC3905832.1 polysaccharide deacetylase family protein [Tamlana sp. 2201CG12-4]
MTLTPVKTPVVVKKMFPNYIWDIATTENVIYLTFDDGPTPEITNWTLNVLEAYKAKATFFCIGKNIEKHPDIFQNILNNGHAIGNHTQNHIKGWKTKTKDYLKNIELCEYALKSRLPDSSAISHQTLATSLFRPPYGQITPKQGKKLIALGYKIIMWDVLSFDWDTKVDEETCLNNVIEKAYSGSIVVFHDSVKASKNMQYALPKILEYFSNKGYTFKALYT